MNTYRLRVKCCLDAEKATPGARQDYGSRGYCPFYGDGCNLNVRVLTEGVGFREPAPEDCPLRNGRYIVEMTTSEGDI